LAKMLGTMHACTAGIYLSVHTITAFNLRDSFYEM